MPIGQRAPRSRSREAAISHLDDRRLKTAATPEVMRVNGCDVTIVRSTDASTLSWPDLSLVVVIRGSNPGASSPTAAADTRPTDRNAVVVTVGLPAGDPAKSNDRDSLAIADVPSLIHRVLGGVTTTLGDRAPALPVEHPVQGGNYDNRAAQLLARLTSKERQILVGLMDGMTAQQLADDLYISLPTVRGHIQAIFQKLQVATQLAAVVMAYKAGWNPER
jgi:DNA-binding CsgD family transcriptional regulator